VQKNQYIFSEKRMTDSNFWKIFLFFLDCSFCTYAFFNICYFILEDSFEILVFFDSPLGFHRSLSLQTLIVWKLLSSFFIMQNPKKHTFNVIEFFLNLSLIFLKFIIYKNEVKLRIKPKLFLIYQEMTLRSQQRQSIFLNKIFPDPNSMNKIGTKQIGHTSSISETQLRLHRLPPLYQFTFFFKTSS